MADTSFLDWPFLDDRHRTLARELEAWCAANLGGHGPHHHPETIEEVDARCRDLVRMLGEGGWLRHAVPAGYGGVAESLDVRSLCILRETLARHDGLADFAFAMQGLGTGSITLAGSPEMKARYLPPVGRGERIAAFALSEPDAGSDVAAMATTARLDGNHWVLDGTKTWISNGGIADHYVVFARTGPEAGAKGLGAFVVDADAAGLTIADRIEVIAPHPLATLRFEGCRVPADRMLGNPGDGFRIAMATLDIFRSTVGAAALGFARRALDEAIARTSARKIFGGTLSDLQIPQAMLADMATDVDASALLVYRAAWTKDALGRRVTRESAMAKMVATEAAQRTIDAAVQLHGGLGVMKGVKVEELYREIRALRIYEGATEVQKVVIARQTLAAAAGR
ncbi:MAG: acyl-CoA dehydrogenase family protein [Rhodospirillales bacterium]